MTMMTTNYDNNNNNIEVFYTSIPCCYIAIVIIFVRNKNEVMTAINKNGALNFIGNGFSARMF